MVNRVTTTIPEGSTYDIDFGNWTEDVQGLAQFEFGTLSRKTTGLLKASNKFLKILLTKQGSDPFFPKRGTYLEDIIHRGGESDTQLGTFVVEQMNSALSQLQAIQAENDFPETENIISANLVEFDRVAVDKIYVRIVLTSEAGENASVTVPVIGG